MTTCYMCGAPPDWQDTVLRMVDHLCDALVMFEQIEHNRNMPPMAYTQAQYAAKGRQIREFLTRKSVQECINAAKGE